MARVFGHLVEPRLPLLIVAIGCGSPISNAPFRDEPQFVAVLVDDEEVATPAAFDPPDDDATLAPLLTRTILAARDYRDFMALPLEISRQLRDVGPTTRTLTRRTWAPSALVVPITTEDAPRLETLWVRADVLKLDDRRFEARIDVAAEETGTFETVGTAVDDGAGEAQWRWEIAAAARLLGLPVSPDLGTFEFGLDPDGADGERRVEARHGTGPVLGNFWVVEGATGFGFNGRFEVTGDGFSWPGELFALELEDGGVASGRVDVADERLEFAACWDSTGRPLWQGGPDPRIVQMGDPTACPAVE